jgi:glucosyl-3-phosphoglycerate phosphatase
MAVMTLPELYILRHGETLWNRERRMQGALDSALTDLGRAQARAIGAMLAARGVTAATHAILSSPQGRCVTTARLAFGADPRLDPRLAEIGMGDWAGLTRDQIAARWPGPPGEGFMQLYARIPGGEGFAALAERCRAFLAGLDRPAVIVTHGMTSRFLRAAALGLDPAEVAGGQGVVHRINAGRAEVLAPGDLPRGDGLQGTDGPDNTGH